MPSQAGADHRQPHRHRVERDRRDGRGREHDQRDAVVQQRREQREKAQRHDEFELPRRRNDCARQDAGDRGDLPCQPQHDAAADESTRHWRAGRRIRESAGSSTRTPDRSAGMRAGCATGDRAACRYGAIAALYIRKRRLTTKHESTITANGAPAASSCAAMICAAPLNMIIDIASAATGEAPAADRADAADDAERDQADGHRQHVARSLR